MATAEQLARANIDRSLTAAGWSVQDAKQANIHAARGVAIREFHLNPGFGEADYPHYIDSEAAGVIEAKREGATLTGPDPWTSERPPRQRRSCGPGFDLRSNGFETSRATMEPAKGQFQLYYRQGADHLEYQPDFVGETADAIYMLEPKMRKELDDPVVLAKKEVAESWCENATHHATANGGKRWKYVLIPHDAIAENMTLVGLVAQFSK